MRRPSYANVTATLALVVALGGGTAIAVDKINADRVDGLSAKRVDYRAKATQADPPFRRFFRLAGLVLRARCISQSGHFLEVEARSRQNNAEIQIAGAAVAAPNDDLDVQIDRDFDAGQALDFPEPDFNIQQQGTLTYSTRKGSHVTLIYQVDVGSVLGTTPDINCFVGGTAMHSPP